MQENFYLTEKLPPYVFAAIYKLKQEAAAKGTHVLDFGMGNPDFSPPQHVMDKLAELSKDPKNYGYSVTGGIDVLKKALVAYYQRRFGVDLDYKTESLVTIGAKEGIASLATAISDDQNYMVVPNPSYPIHTFAFIISKSRVEYIDSINGYEFLEKFKKFVENASKKPAAVIVSFPNNPTSEIVGFDFYEELVAFCKKYQIYIISDIAYGEIYFDDSVKPNSVLQVKGAKEIAIEFSSVSKSYSMAGCRVGFAAGSPNLIKALYKIKSYLDYGSFSPLQMVAADALSEKSDEYLKDLRAKYKHRAEFLSHQLETELSWKTNKPQASMYLWNKIPQKFAHLSSFEFCKKMIEEVGVAMSPGSSFGSNGDGFVRFSLVRNDEEALEAVKRLKTVF